MDDALSLVDGYFHWPKVDRRGERWTLCALHDDRHVGSFSYSERGFRCFACGAKGSIRRLAELLGLVGPADRRPILRPRPRPRPSPPPAPPRAWQADPDYWRRFIPPSPTALAYYHARGFTDETIRTYRLGSGVLPSSKALRERAVLPVFSGGRLVGLRGRRLHPDDPFDKWLCSAGSETVLFGLESLHAGWPCVVTEAPYAAILCVQEHPKVGSVASTSGCGTWKDEWTEAIVWARPSEVLVWMDNDEAGRLASAKVGNALAKAHLPVHVYRWPKGTPPKYDLADLILAGIQKKCRTVMPEADPLRRTA